MVREHSRSLQRESASDRRIRTSRLCETSTEQVQGAPRVERSTSRLIEPRLCMLAATLVGRARANSPAHPTSPANPQSLSVVAGPSDQRGLCPDLGESCCLVARLCPTWSLPLGLATWFRCAGPARARGSESEQSCVSQGCNDPLGNSVAQAELWSDHASRSREPAQDQEEDRMYTDRPWPRGGRALVSVSH